MKQIGLATACILLAGWNEMSAQFTISGQIRPRTEYLHGYKAPADSAQKAAFWTEQRSRLNIDYASEKYSFGLQLQDIRVWGSTAQLNKTDGFTSVHQAWGAVHFNKNLTLKIGRQELIYDDHRILGSVEWAAQARSHDLAKFTFKDSLNQLDLGLAFNQASALTATTIYTVTGNYKTMQYLWYHRDIKNLGLSILFLNNGLQYSKTDTAGIVKYSTKYGQTAGTHLTYKKDKLGLTGSFYYQMGKDGSDKDIAAMNAKLEVSYNLTKQFGILGGFELLSGTSQVDTANKKNESFNPLYGTNHKFNGYMDYFYVGNHLNTVGLNDAYLTLGYKTDKFYGGLTGHLFMANADILDTENLINTGNYKAMSAMLGTEIDLTLQYKLNKAVSFEAVYCHMIATESMIAVKGGRTDEISNYAYLQVNIAPTFFKQDVKPETVK